MRIIRMRLKDFRGVTHADVSFDESNVTIVQGPNESGKSSIAEALSVLREAKVTSKRAAVQELKPVDKDVGTEVELEARSGPYHFTYFKRFNKATETLLTIHAPTNETFSGEEAHLRADQIFAETLDEQLWDALQVVQGKSLEQPRFADIEPLKGALEVSGADPGSGGSGLLERISAERSRYFSKTGPTGDYKKLQTQVDRIHDEVSDLKSELRQADHLVEQHERGGREVLDLRESQTELTEKRDVLEKRVASLAQVRNALKVSIAKLETAQSSEFNASTEVERREALRAEVENARTLLDEARGSAEDGTNDPSPLKSAHAAAARDLDAAKVHAEQARTRAEEATRRFELAKATDELEIIGDRLERARTHTAEKQRITAWLETHRVEGDVVHELITARSTLENAQAQRESVAPRLHVERLAQSPVLVDGVQMESDIDRAVLDSATVEAPGVLRVSVTVAADADTGALAVAEAHDAWEAMLQEHGVKDLDEAKSEAAQHFQNEQRLAEVGLELASARGDLTMDDLTQRHTSLTEKVSTLEATVGTARDEAGVHGEREWAERVHEANAEVERAQNNLVSAQAHLETTQEELAEKQERAREVRHRVALAEAAHEAASARLDSARASVTDEKLQANHVSRRNQVGSAEEEVETHQSTLAEEQADQLDVALAGASSATERAAEELARLESEQHKLLGRLEEVGGRGLQDTHDEKAAILEDETHSLAVIDSRAKAARLLSDTMFKHHAAAQQRYVKPFKDTIESLGKPVFGSSFEVTISIDLSIESRTLEGRTIPFAQLSAGTREQLAVLGRLACAQLVDPNEGAPLIIDDAFGFSDSERLDAVAHIFDQVGNTAQIIILTCYPKRFQAIGSAATVRLGTS